MLAENVEFKTDLRSGRQLEGIAKAKEHGVKFGRPTKRTAEIDLEIYNKRNEGVTIGILIKVYDLDPVSIYRVLSGVCEIISTEKKELSGWVESII
jgi:DNA invertase Pin-like site-specific DNA recombinase